jgi:mycothiol synthase
VPTEADAEAIAALFPAGRGVDAEEVRSWLRNPRFDLAADFRVLEANGSLTAYVDVHLEGDRLSVDWTALDVAAGHALLDWAAERALEQGASRMRCSAWEPGADRALLLGERGFVPVRTSLEMRVEPLRATSEPTWPGDVRVRTVRQVEEAQVHDVIEDAFADTHDFQPRSYDEWAAWALEPNRFDRDLWFAALEHDEIVAVTLCEYERAREPGLGWIESLAVRRDHRRRGLGRALLLHAFREFVARGRTAAGLSVDAANPTGAVRLYESVGMRPVWTRVVYEKRLAV